VVVAAPADIRRFRPCISLAIGAPLLASARAATQHIA